MKNKKTKIIALTTSFLLLFVFGSFLLPMVKVTGTHTTTEEIEDFSCVDDTYVYGGPGYVDRGSSSLLTVGYDVSYELETEIYIAFFKFDLTNKPENCIKVEVILTFKDYGLFILIPFYVSNNSWNEEELTSEETGNIVDYPPVVIPFSCNYRFVYSVGFMAVSCNINLIEYSESQFVSFCLCPTIISSDFEEDISTIYSKEYPVESVRPKIIWTVEHEIVSQQNNEIWFSLIGLSIGLIIGIVAVGVIIVLNKRKSKF